MMIVYSMLRTVQNVLYVTRGSKVCHPPLHLILVESPFQILGNDIMELPRTAAGNKYMICPGFFDKMAHGVCHP